MRQSLPRSARITKIAPTLVLFELLALLVSRAATQAADAPTNSASTNRVLMIDPSSAPVAAGQATLSIGTLKRAAGVYAGDYRIDVSPFFFKSETGKLAIVISDYALAQAHNRVAVEISGTATTSGSGKTRRIDAIATPSDSDQGTLKLWFIAGGRKMIFESAYHFAGKETASSQTH